MIVLAKYGVLLLALPLFYMWFKGDEDKKRATLLSLLSLVIALLINQIIGHIYLRQRPFAFHEVNLLLAKSADPSFPSDHSAFVFAIAGIIMLKNRRIGIFSLAIAVLVGISRIFVGTHYPGDVLGGAMVGLVASVFVWRLRSVLDPITSFLVGIARKVKLA
ncbi:MAG: undecaprenyl-diphosphatase [Thermoleophilia bacterium]